MQINKRKIAGLLCLAVIPTLALADDDVGPRYTYVEGGYEHIDSTADGWATGGSVALLPNVHLLGRFASLDANVGNATDHAFNVGLGFNTPITPRLDAVGRAYFLHDKPSGASQDSGYAIEGLMRWMANDRLELDGGVQYQDFGSNRNTTYLKTAAYYDVIPHLAVGAELLLAGSSETTWLAGARFYFGNPSWPGRSR